MSVGNVAVARLLLFLPAVFDVLFRRCSNRTLPRWGVGMGFRTGDGGDGWFLLGVTLSFGGIGVDSFTAILGRFPTSAPRSSWLPRLVIGSRLVLLLLG